MSAYRIQCKCGYQLEINDNQPQVKCAICGEQYALHSAFGDTGGVEFETGDDEEDENGF